jgi:thioredoxin reductase (NADPH)
VRSDPQFAIRTGVVAVELEGDRGRFVAVLARDRDSGEILRFPAAAAFVFIGLKPNDLVSWVTPWNAIRAGSSSRAPRWTSLPGVFAAGDVRSVATKQLGSAVGDGIAALLMTRRYLEVHHHKAMPLVDA